MVRNIGRTFIAGLLVVLLSGIVSAQQRELVVWMWPTHMSDAYNAWYERFTEKFEEANPGATVRFEFHHPRGGETLTVALAGGVPPDVTVVSVLWARDMYEAGMLTELNPWLERSESLDMEMMTPLSSVMTQKNGRVYGMPWSHEAQAILYNRRHLQEAALDDRPGAITSWEVLADYARRLTRTDADHTITRSGYFPSHANINAGFTSYLYANGGALYSDDQTSVAFNDSKGREALQFIHDLVHVHQVIDPSVNHNGLPRGDVSMALWDTTATAWAFGDAQDYPEWLGMTPLAPGPQGSASSSVGWTNLFVVPTGAANQELAWSFMELWLSLESQVEQVQIPGWDRVASPRKDFYQTDVFHDLVNRLPYLQTLPEVLVNSQPLGYIRSAEIEQELRRRIFPQVYEGTMAPEIALDEAERVANQILGERH